MKNKIKKILLLIVSIFALPLIAKADVGMPDYYAYDVIVTNPDGAQMYDWELKKMETIIPPDTKITVNFEHTYKNVVYLDTSYKDSDGFIKLDDIKVYDEKVDFSKLQKNPDNTQYYTIKETIMYNGPSKVYGKVKNVTIPTGTTLKYEYSAGGMEAPMWIYTEYEGNKGWVLSYPYFEENTLVEVAKEKNNKVYIFEDKVEVRELPGLEGKVLGTISKDQELTFKYYINTEPRVKSFYIETSDIKGWITYEYDPFTGKQPLTQMYVTNNTVIIEEGLEVYKHYNDKTPIKDIKIPYLETITSYYSYIYDINETTNDMIYKEYIMISYNGNNYWIKDISSDKKILPYEKIKMEVNKDTSLFAKQDKSEKLSDQLKEGTEVISLGRIFINNEESLYLIEYDDKKYWVDSNDLDYIEYIEDDPTEPISKEEPKKDKKDKEDEDSLTPKEIAFICAGAAVVLALFSVVTIILINKNKQSKKEDIKE